MQLKFVRLMTLSESKRNELLTQMLYLAKKMGLDSDIMVNYTNQITLKSVLCN